MPSFLLDTHILVWWKTDPKRLTSAQAAALSEVEKGRAQAAVSAITLRELAKMVERGRMEISVPLDLWLEEVVESPHVSVLPLTARVAAESVQLGEGVPNDPADQIIIATARCHGLRLMTADERIRRWGKVPLV